MKNTCNTLVKSRLSVQFFETEMLEKNLCMKVKFLQKLKKITI